MEALFGQIRMKGGRNNNPTLQQINDSAISLRVQGSAALDPIRGNCKRTGKSTDFIVDETPFPKRKRK